MMVVVGMCQVKSNEIENYNLLDVVSCRKKLVDTLHHQIIVRGKYKF